MIEVIGIDHIVIRTTRLPDMLDFYSDFLGCPVERQLDEAVGLVQLRAGNALIDLVVVESELGKLGGAAPQQDGRNIDHFCLSIAAMSEEELLRQISARDLEHSGFARRYGAQGFGRSIYINDPEGNVVELKFWHSTPD